MVPKQNGEQTLHTNIAKHHRKQPHKPGNKIRGHIGISYTQELCESMKIYAKKVWHMKIFQSDRILRNILVTPKDKISIKQKSGAVY